MNLKNNEKGNALLMVMFALLAVGSATYYIMDVRKNADTSNASTKYENDIKLIVNDIEAQLSNTRKCVLSFNPNLTPKFIVSKVDASDPADIKIAKTRYPILGETGGDDGYTDSKIKIAKFELDLTTDNLNVEFVNKLIRRGGSTNNEFTVKKIPMYIERTGTSITNCRSVSKGTIEIWSRSSKTLNNIFYAGWAGIGIKESLAPPAIASLLHVSKSAKDKVSGSAKFSDEDIRVEKTVFADKFYYFSDKKLKKNIGEIYNPLHIISSLRGVSFDWKEDQRHDYGFIAQEVKNIVPQIVEQKNKEDSLKVEYGKIIPILVEAIKAQDVQIKALKKRLNRLSSN